MDSLKINQALQKVKVRFPKESIRCSEKWKVRARRILRIGDVRAGRGLRTGAP